jgi:hypothetical protein
MIPSKRSIILTELIVYAAIGFLLLAICTILFGGCSPSEGYRDGYIQKFSHKGYINKSWEGELALLGFGGSHSGKPGQSSEGTWSFTVSDAKIAKQINDLPPGTYVRLHYTESAFHNPITTGTNYQITTVEPVTQP